MTENQRRVLNERNSKTSFAKRGNRTNEEFKIFLTEEYLDKKRSMTSIAKELNISHTIVSRYLSKYGIYKRTRGEQQIGEQSPNWKGGRRIKPSGYVEVYCPNHPRVNKRGCVYEHQLVIEQSIGRYLREDEVVHHIDRNKSNNSLSNLMLLTRAEHTRLHLREGDFGKRR